MPRCSTLCLMLFVPLFGFLAWSAWQAQGPALDNPGVGAERETCSPCHSDFAESHAESAHRGLSCSLCHARADEHRKAQDPSKVLPVVDFRAESCGVCHRFQYETYFMSEAGTPGQFGGTPADPQAHPKTKDFPLYNKIVAGHGFTKEYNEDRSHKFILRDHIDVKRPKNAACLNCKATPVAYYWGRQWKGVTLVESAKWEDVIARIPKEMLDYGASCTQCHDPHGARLRVINKGLEAAIAERGVNPYWPEKNARRFEDADSQQKAILVCAQCHVEYVCGPGADKQVRFVFSWRKVRDLDDYYRKAFNYQQDWVHSLLNEPLIKSQHPETELFWESKYERAGASCVTCHMPKVTFNGRQVTSHWLVSPLRYIDRHLNQQSLGAFPCAQCHTVTPEVLRAQVLRVQQHVNAAQQRVQQALSESIDAIAAAKQASQQGTPVDGALLQRAVQLHQWAHVRWENLAVSENSMGFHNPEEVFRELNEALDYARQAQMLALQATNRAARAPTAR
ncbi:MAG: ammonia-forming cytochrome c nitrite reductase subunit c552 [Bryobacterales bacterium]|nr:ammonia-forming cytochrome c nitrite reductase subunit c552 [Bryobacteraceae bacterium]MDW8354026.1 ammonia-forming cytochrome c nitrite reductase subunit c552 [Bryobacterales bacterium]